MQRTSYAVWIWWPEASTCRWDVSCLDRNRRRQLTQNVMHWCLCRFTARQIRTSTVNTPDRAMLQIDSCYGDLFWLIGRYWRLWKGNRTRGHPWEYQKTCCVSSTVWCTSLGLNISSFSWLLPNCMHEFISNLCHQIVYLLMSSTASLAKQMMILANLEKSSYCGRT